MTSKDKPASLVIRVMQNKITTRQYYTPTGMVKLKRVIVLNFDENVVHLKSSVLLVGIQNVKAHFKIIWQYLIKSKRNLPYNTTIPLLGVYSEEIKTYVHTDMDINVHGSIIHNIIKLNTTQMSIGS